MPADGHHVPTGPLMLAATAVACWPVWGWYADRLGESPDDVLAVGSLIALLVLSVRRRPATADGDERTTAQAGPERRERSVLILAAPGLVLLVYALTLPFVPRLASAALAFLALGLTWSRWRHGTPFRPWVVGLALLGLPMASSLQFYAGQPLRAASGTVAVALLRLAGFPVERQGVYLRWGEELAMIDAPCSGLRMLWAGLLLACCLAAVFQLRAGAWLVAVGAAAALAVTGNGLRTATLFWIDATGPAIPAAAHAAVGATTFTLAVAALYAVARSLAAEEGRRCAPSRSS